MKRVKLQDYESGYQYDRMKKQVRKQQHEQRVARQNKHTLWVTKEL